MLPARTTKEESLHEVPPATKNCLYVRNAILGNLEAMEVHIRKVGTPEVCKIEVVNLRLIKTCEKGCSLTHRVWNRGRTAAHLELRMDSRQRT